MNRSRPRRFLVALAALACVLFTQLAVAAYACGGDTDPLFPTLCQAHCDQDSRSLDKPSVPPVAPLMPNGLDAAAFVPPQLPPAASAQDELLARTTAPPLAIRLCCFRI